MRRAIGRAMREALRKRAPGLFALVAALAPLGGGASAQTVDFSRVSCAQLNRLPVAQKRQIAVWLHGYYTGATQRPFLDMGAAEAGVRALVDLCLEKPETQLLGEEARGALAGAGPEGPPRAAGRSPGHIVIEQPSATRDGVAEEGAGRNDRPRPVD